MKKILEKFFFYSKKKRKENLCWTAINHHFIIGIKS